MPQTITVDLDHWPLVNVTFRGTLDDAEFDEYLRTLSGILARKTRYGVMIDASHANPPTLSQRRKQTEYMRDNEAAVRLYNVGIAFIITSSIIRGALNAMLWLQPLPSPHTVVSTQEEAKAWILERLKGFGH